MTRGRAVAAGRRVAVGLAVAMVLAGCMPSPATSQAREVAFTNIVFNIGAIVVAGIVWGLATWAIFRYRRRDDRLPKQVANNTPLELTWTAIPIVTVLFLFGVTVNALGRIEAVEPGGMDLHVTAFRWGWRAEYPTNGVVVQGSGTDVPEIVLPVDTPIHVTLDSSDVVHSFFVPRFLYKRDAIPGRPSSFDLRIEDEGIYPGHCAEFCGVGHPDMLFTIRAVDQATFEAWLAGAPLASP